MEKSIFEDMDEQKEFFQQAVDKWGINSQIVIGIEELSELTQALTKFLRFGPNHHQIKVIIDELIDVFLIMQEIRYILINNYNVPPDIFDVQYEVKYTRFLKRLLKD